MNDIIVENGIDLPATEQFMVGRSSMKAFENSPKRNASGILILCRKGRASIQADDFEGVVRRNASLFLLPGTMLSLRNRSEEFEVDYFAFSQELFAEVSYRLEIAMLAALKRNPMVQFGGSTAPLISAWFRLLYTSYIDRENRFRSTIIRNRLQIVLLESCDRLTRKKEGEMVAKQGGTNRQGDIFNRFAQLVHQYATEEREVAFYAEKLCISTRYLSTIVQSVVHHSPKELIDHVVMTEIRQLLLSTDLSVQEIAYRMHFPDQSYLGRYFRKHTGLSPTAFRQTSR